MSIDMLDRTLPQRLAPYTLLSPDQLAFLHTRLADVLHAGVPGDVVEAGVCNGGSAALLASLLRDQPERRLWLYDTWTGLPRAGVHDGALAQSHTGAFAGTQERVCAALAEVDYAPERCVWRAGDLRDTLAHGQPRPDAIAFLHLDLDFYDGVYTALSMLYQRVSVGGVVVLDDFGYWPGCRTAFFDWCARTGRTPLIERHGPYSLWWVHGTGTNVPNRED